VEQSDVADIENADGQFWAFMMPFESIKSHNEFPVKDTFYEEDPQTLKKGFMINVSIFLDDLSKRKYETRMFHQKGRFYISGESDYEIAMDKQPAIAPLLLRFRVPAGKKPSIR